MIEPTINSNEKISRGDLTSVKQQMNQLTETTFKEFNTIYSNSALLNYLLNNKLYLLQENHINFKTVLESDHFEFLDLETQINLFELFIEEKALSFHIISKKENNHLLLYFITLIILLVLIIILIFIKKRQKD